MTIQDLTLEREASDPSPLVFKAIAQEGKNIIFRAAGTIPGGDFILTLGFTRPKKPTDPYKVNWRLLYPLERTVDSVTTVVGIARKDDNNITIPPDMLLSERGQFSYLLGSIAYGAVKGYIDDLVPML